MHDLVEGWDPSGAAPLIELSDSPDTEQVIETNVNPETVMAKPGGYDRSGYGCMAETLARRLMAVAAAERATTMP